MLPNFPPKRSWGALALAADASPLIRADDQRQNLTMRALIVKLLIGVAIGLIIIGVFIIFAHSSTPV